MRKGKLVFLTILVFSLALFLSGCSSTTPTNQSPSANFNANPTSGEAPLEVSFDGSNSSDSDGSVISYDWKFGDGSTGSGKTTTHTYNSQGSYSAKLTVTDDEGSMGATTRTIAVESSSLSPPSWILGKWADKINMFSFTFSSDNVTYETPTATVDFGTIAEDYYAEENSSSSSYSLTIPSEALSGSQQVEGKEATFIFDEVNSTELTFSMQAGATTIGPMTLYNQSATNNPPEAKISTSPSSQNGTVSVEIGQTVDFDASNSSDPDGSIASFHWDLGDGNSDTGQQVSHTYSSEGSFTVQLTVTDDDGAEDTDSVEVEVETSGPEPPSPPG